MLLIFLKFIASAALLFAFYRIVLRGKASYAVSRAYLLALPIVSLIISVLTFEVYPSGTEFAIEQIDFGHYTAPAAPVEADYVPDIAPTQVTTAAPAAVPTTTPAAEPVEAKQPIVIDWMGLLQWAVPAISLLLLLLAVYHIGKVLVIKSQMDVENTAEGYNLISSPSVDTPFSFAKTIFLPTSLNEPGKSLIIRHEKAHIRHRHYADVWFMELITRLLWFNPFVWLCRNELRNVHEFQADHDVIASDVNINAYQTTLLEMVMNVSSPVVNGFNHSFIRRRFVEMKKSTVGTLGRVAKIGTLVWIGAMFCAFTFTEKKPEPVSDATETAVQAADSVKTLGPGKFVIEGAVDPGITDSCYLIYFADENFEIIENPVACVPVVDKKFHYEVELNDLTVCRIRCIFPGGEICSDWIETFAAPGVTFELTVHNGFYSSSSLYNGYLTKIRRLADTYCKNHHLNDGLPKPEGLYKTWENVKYGNWNNQKVNKVEFCEKKTIVTLSMSRWDSPISILTSDVCLRDTAGNLYKMLHNESGGTRRYLDYIRGARYSFEPLPKGVTQFDLVQKVNKKATFYNVNGESQEFDINDYNINVIVEKITENLAVNQKPNFTITFKTKLTDEVTGFEIVQTLTDERRSQDIPIGEVDLDANGEATFSTYLEEPIFAYIFPAFTDARKPKSYSMLFPLIPGEKAEFTLTSSGSYEDDRETGVLKIEIPKHELTGKGFYKYWNEAEKALSKISNENANDFEKMELLQKEYMKRHNDNLGCVMQYILHWRADYSVLSKKILQYPLVKQMKENDDVWAKEREEARKRQEEARANTAPGKMFVDLNLMNMTNTKNCPSLSDIVGKGRYVLAHFSYSNDGAIKDSVEALWKKHKGGQVDVIGIKCSNVSFDFYDKTYKDMGVSYKLYYDSSHEASKYGLGGKDEVMLFGPDGTILRRDIAAEELEKVVEEVLQ
ncbi:MAG: hypothetical protein IKZ99_13000 [Salinivirgaceae bacterium]|nr:hypothetical protein [Salinivirgaceae bacterium]